MSGFAGSSNGGGSGGSGGRDGSFSGARGRAQLPLLDRLMDNDPDQPVDRPLSALASLAALRTSVRADLEALLNARRRWRSWDPRLRELGVSPLAFGLPDFSAGAFNDPLRREQLRGEVEACILRFEPRFSRVHVVLLPSDHLLTGSLRLRIEALLHADPSPEAVSFDTVVDANTAAVVVTAQEE